MRERRTNDGWDRIHLNDDAFRDFEVSEAPNGVDFDAWGVRFKGWLERGAGAVLIPLVALAGLCIMAVNGAAWYSQALDVVLGLVPAILTWRPHGQKSRRRGEDSPQPIDRP